MSGLGEIDRGTGIVGAVGVVLFSVAVVHHVTEIGRLGVEPGPFAALLLDALPALGLVYAGYWLAGTGLEARSTRRVARWCLLGSLVFAVTIGLSIAIRIGEGRTVAEPLFTLLVTAEAGALAGFVAGYHRARALADKRRAERAVDGLAFVNDITRHDLRNDLQVVDANAELIETDTTGDAADRARSIQRSAADARERLADTAAIAETLRTDTEFETVDLVGVVSDAATHVKELHGVTVRTDLPDSAYVTGNEGLRSIVDNLLENAAEHNDSDDPCVAVAVEAAPGNVRLVVRDNGPGLADDTAAILSGDADGPAGGLRIVHRLVDEYGGDIAVSDNEPRGTTVTVSLPASSPAPE